MRFKLSTLLACACAAVLAGCLGGSTEPINTTGTYVLTSINGSALPYTYSNGSAVKSEVLTLSADGTYRDDITRPDGSALVDVGNYNNFGNIVSFADVTLGITYQATATSTSLTIVIGNYSEIFMKQ